MAIAKAITTVKVTTSAMVIETSRALQQSSDGVKQ